MKAVWVHENGGLDGIRIADVEEPVPAENEALIRVHAAGVNRADLMQAAGKYPPPAGFAVERPGLEFAGEIVALGPNAAGFAIGDRVFGITAGHAQAEFIVSPLSLLAAIPSALSFTEAGAVPEAYITAHDAVFTQNSLRSGETLLIHAVGSGVGQAALALAAAAGAKTIGTSRTADKIDRLQASGLGSGIIVEDGDFVEQVLAATDGKGVDVILDLVGGPYFSQDLKVLASQGRISVVGLTAGARAEIDLRMLLQKRASVRGTVLRSRSLLEKAAATANFIREVLPLFEAGVIAPQVDRIFKLADAREAYDYVASNKSFGKVVLEC